MNGEQREPARRFTEEEMRLVRETDLPVLLTRLGCHVKKVGHSYTTTEMTVCASKTAVHGTDFPVKRTVTYLSLDECCLLW